MANYTLQFKSLRNQRDYTLTIVAGGSGGTLRGAAEPFTTDEGTDEDIFTPVRTQTGYIRIVDDGTVNWKSLIPTSDTSNPVVLTHIENNTTVIDWMGFMQTQTFDGPMYDYRPVREFPVQCALSALGSVQVDTQLSGGTHIVNFFGLIANAFSHVSSLLTFGNFYIQGGNDAFVWLLSKFDWQNLLTDNNGTLESGYSYLEALEDMCRFWGFSMRTSGKDVYMTMRGASDVTGKLTMTLAQIQTAAGGQSAGTVTAGFYNTKAAGTGFASTDQEETIMRGYNKAIVKADCNKAEIGVDFNNQAVQDALEANTSWYWVGEENSQVGYFATNPPKAGASAITTDLLVGSTVAQKAQFKRVQIYSSAEDTMPTESNVIDFIAPYDGTVLASLETTRVHRFGAGSLEMTGDIFWGPEKKPFSEGSECMRMRIGIGLDRASAKWFKIKNIVSSSLEQLDTGWYATQSDVFVFPKSSQLAVGTLQEIALSYFPFTFPKFPTTSQLVGKIFIDFLGSNNDAYGIGETFMLANFKVKFSRDSVEIPNTTSSAPQARMVSVKRQSSKEYKSSAWGKNTENWSADCIYASDDHMDYGFGLLMNNNGSWLETVSYGQNQMHPEAHLSAAVISFWQTARRMVSLDMLYNGIGDVRPNDDVTDAGGGTYHPIAISHNWRDDIIKLKMISV